MKCPKCHKEVEKRLSVLPLLPCGDTLGKRIQHSGNSDEKGAAEPPIRKKTGNRNYKIFQTSKKKKAEIQQETASMSASVCGDTAGILLLSAVKYFFCLIFQGKKTICTAKL